MCLYWRRGSVTSRRPILVGASSPCIIVRQRLRFVEWMLRPPPVIKIIIVHPIIRHLLMLSPLPFLAPLPQFDPSPHQILPSTERLPASIGSRAVVIDEVRRRLVRSRSCCLSWRMALNVTGRHDTATKALWARGFRRTGGTIWFVWVSFSLAAGRSVACVPFERKSHTDVRAKLLSELTLT